MEPVDSLLSLYVLPNNVWAWTAHHVVDLHLVLKIQVNLHLETIDSVEVPLIWYWALGVIEPYGGI